MGEFGTLGLIWSATLRHCVLAASGVSWANAVAMKAETTRRPFFPACAKALRMK
jgi:ribosomal protein L28